MNNQEWLDQVKQHKQVLEQLIQDWHPASKSKIQDHDMEITAPNVEMVSNPLRKQVLKDWQKSPVTVLEIFNNAIDDGDINYVYGILDDAWLGVPESTDCWKLVGFREVVNLLGDPPEACEDAS